MFSKINDGKAAKFHCYYNKIELIKKSHYLKYVYGKGHLIVPVYMIDLDGESFVTNYI